MLFDMTFAQLLSLVQTRNAREVRAQEEAERRAKLREENPGYTPPPPMKDLNDPDNLPSVSDISRVFGNVMG
jgi:hypothetical protein